MSKLITKPLVETSSTILSAQLNFKDAEIAALKEMLQAAIDKNVQQAMALNSLEEELFVDPKTGLSNERYMMKVAPSLIEAAQEKFDRRSKSSKDLVIVYTDINGLKNINDNLGHEAGDLLIENFANALKQQFQRKSDILVHKSGDEFVLILPNTSVEQVAKKFDVINGTTKFSYQGKEILVQCGHGCSIATPEKTLEKMLTEADAHLYTNKEDRKSKGHTTIITDKICDKEPANDCGRPTSLTLINAGSRQPS